MTRSESAVTTANSMIGQINDSLGVADERRGVAGDKVLILADADHQRAAQPGGNDHVGMFAEDNRQAVGAAELGQGFLNGADQRFVRIGRLISVADFAVAELLPVGIVVLSACGHRGLFFQATGNQMGDDFGIGRGAEDVAFGFELLLSARESFRSRRCGPGPELARRRGADGRFHRLAHRA